MSLTLLAETDHSTIWQDEKTKVVVKRFRNPLEARTRTQWDMEVDALKRIGAHPGITQLISCSATDLTISLSVAPGRVLSSHDRVSLAPHAHQICLQLAGALAHIHDHGLIHDDVKPDNVMILIPSSSAASAPHHGEPTVTLIDFGACIRQGSFTKSGTPWYMAPEYMDMVKGAKTDVWALGITMAWVLDEFPLPERSREEWILPLIWEDTSAMEMMREWLQVVSQVRERLKMKATNVLERTVVDMLDPDVSTRMTAKQVLTMLEAQQ